MEGDTGHVLEKASPGHAWQLVGSNLSCQLAISHVLGGHLRIDVEIPAWCIRGDAASLPQAGQPGGDLGM